jgi:hypothetical protein
MYRSFDFGLNVAASHEPDDHWFRCRCLFIPPCAETDNLLKKLK